MVYVRLRVANAARGKCQAETAAVQLAMHSDGTKVQHVVQHHAGKGDKSIPRLDEGDLYFRYLHPYLFAYVQFQ
jgi:hypothetical protein